MLFTVESRGFYPRLQAFDPTDRVCDVRFMPRMISSAINGRSYGSCLLPFKPRTQCAIKNIIPDPSDRLFVTVDAIHGTAQLTTRSKTIILNRQKDNNVHKVFQIHQEAIYTHPKTLLCCGEIFGSLHS